MQQKNTFAQPRFVKLICLLLHCLYLEACHASASLSLCLPVVLSLFVYFTFCMSFHLSSNQLACLTVFFSPSLSSVRQSFLRPSIISFVVRPSVRILSIRPLTCPCICHSFRLSSVHTSVHPSFSQSACMSIL
jgi:hypothetical protein